MATYLVTGGAGFIGSHIVTALVDRDQSVRVLDNFLTGNRRNLEHLGDRVEIIEGDLRSYADVEGAVQGADFVLHQGALPSVPRSVQDPITTNECNVTGTIHVLWASHRAGVRRVHRLRTERRRLCPRSRTCLPRRYRRTPYRS